MNCYVGPAPGDSHYITPYKIFKKTTLLANSSDLFVFTEEAPSSINDGFFCFFGGNSPDNGGWSDCPAAYHGRACGLSFADGHAEIHKWTGSVPQYGNFTTFPGGWPPGSGEAATDVDYQWLRIHGVLHN